MGKSISGDTHWDRNSQARILLSHILLLDSREGLVPSPAPAHHRIMLSLFPSGLKCLLIFAIAVRGETRGRRLSGVMESRSPIISSETSTQILYRPSNPLGVAEVGEFLLGGAKVKSRLCCSLRLQAPKGSERRVSMDRVLVFPTPGPEIHPPRQTDTWGHLAASTGSEMHTSEESRSARAVRIAENQRRSVGR